MFDDFVGGAIQSHILALAGLSNPLQDRAVAATRSEDGIRSDGGMTEETNGDLDELHCDFCQVAIRMDDIWRCHHEKIPKTYDEDIALAGELPVVGKQRLAI